mmetsp:Transcript_8025/g.14727  ORF Transcript_8025/g.14727 Transcript_8025/m.14727 type:complete len:201 (-) Transcript_8025:3903-4505(-)
MLQSAAEGWLWQVTLSPPQNLMHPRWKSWRVKQPRLQAGCSLSAWMRSQSQWHHLCRRPLQSTCLPRHQCSLLAPRAQLARRRELRKRRRNVRPSFGCHRHPCHQQERRRTLLRACSAACAPCSSDRSERDGRIAFSVWCTNFTQRLARRNLQRSLRRQHLRNARELRTFCRQPMPGMPSGSPCTATAGASASHPGAAAC